MLEYDREQIGRQAAEHGFIRDTFEKTCRLAELLVYFDRDIVLSKYLALKGGTAINMTIFRLPRLSVDIDLDFTENIPLAEMMDRRQLITETIQLYMTSAGYELTTKSKYRHSLDSFVFAYTNAGGVRDNIKIEINYSQRSHILPLEKRPIETFGMFTPVEVQTVSPMEIFAGKINPELLFEGEILARIKDHPMVAWKMAQMRRNSSSNEMREGWPHLHEMKNELAEKSGGGRHFIPNVPLNMFKIMKELDCQWDPDAKCWYHDDPKIAREAERLVEHSRGQENENVRKNDSNDIDHEI